MTEPLVLPVVDGGLGNSAYLVDLGDGRALAVDPSVDLRQLDDVAAQHRLRVVAVAETHLHADFVSGATRLASRDGATVLGSAAGGRQFPHRGLADGDEVDLGGLTLRAWATPGHTGEHLAYLLLDGARVAGAFTGGSLLVGAAARTDLVSADQTETLARAQYRSLQRLAQLPDETAVYPTHGAGSFCSAPPGAERTTTVGRERATNPLLRTGDEDGFVAALLGSLGSYPTYFTRLGEVNRLGPAVPEGDHLPEVDAEEVAALRAAGAEVVDVRPAVDYAAGHLPGSLAIPLRDVFATWLGWLVPDPTTPVVVVMDPEQDPAEPLWQARKVGFERLAGRFTDLAGWARSGRPLVATPLRGPADVDATCLVDIRQAAEFGSGHVPGARNVELGRLTSADLPDGPLVTMCGAVDRAATGASVLERRGRSDVAILAGGLPAWVDTTGSRVEVDR